MKLKYFSFIIMCCLSLEAMEPEKNPVATESQSPNILYEIFAEEHHSICESDISYHKKVQKLNEMFKKIKYAPLFRAGNNPGPRYVRLTFKFLWPSLQKERLYTYEELYRRPNLYAMILLMDALAVTRWYAAEYEENEIFKKGLNVFVHNVLNGKIEKVLDGINAEFVLKRGLESGLIPPHLISDKDKKRIMQTTYKEENEEIKFLPVPTAQGPWELADDASLFVQLIQESKDLKCNMFICEKISVINELLGLLKYQSLLKRKNFPISGCIWTLIAESFKPEVIHENLESEARYYQTLWTLMKNFQWQNLENPMFCAVESLLFDAPIVVNLLKEEYKKNEIFQNAIKAFVAEGLKLSYLQTDFESDLDEEIPKKNKQKQLSKEERARIQKKMQNFCDSDAKPINFIRKGLGTGLIPIDLLSEKDRQFINKPAKANEYTSDTLLVHGCTPNAHLAKPDAYSMRNIVKQLLIGEKETAQGLGKIPGRPSLPPAKASFSDDLDITKPIANKAAWEAPKLAKVYTASLSDAIEHKVSMNKNPSNEIKEIKAIAVASSDKQEIILPKPILDEQKKVEKQAPKETLDAPLNNAIRSISDLVTKNISDSDKISLINEIFKRSIFNDSLNSIATGLKLLEQEILKNPSNKNLGGNKSFCIFAISLMLDAPAAINWFKNEYSKNAKFQRDFKSFVFAFIDGKFETCFNIQAIALLEKGLGSGIIDANLTDSTNRSLIKIAISKQLIDLIEMLIEAGANISEDTLEYARVVGNEEIITLLNNQNN